MRPQFSLAHSIRPSMLLLELGSFEALKAELERFNVRLKCPKFVRCLAFKLIGSSKTSEVFQLKLAGKLQGEWLAHLVFPICIQQMLHSGIGWGCEYAYSWRARAAANAIWRLGSCARYLAIPNIQI